MRPRRRVWAKPMKTGRSGRESSPVIVGTACPLVRRSWAVLVRPRCSRGHCPSECSAVDSVALKSVFVFLVGASADERRRIASRAGAAQRRLVLTMGQVVNMAHASTVGQATGRPRVGAFSPSAVVASAQEKAPAALEALRGMYQHPMKGVSADERDSASIRGRSGPHGRRLRWPAGGPGVWLLCRSYV
jgi:hypothetical protein